MLAELLHRSGRCAVPRLFPPSHGRRPYTHRQTVAQYIKRLRSVLPWVDHSTSCPSVRYTNHNSDTFRRSFAMQHINNLEWQRSGSDSEGRRRAYHCIRQEGAHRNC